MLNMFKTTIMKKIFMMMVCLMMAIGSYAQREHTEIPKDVLPKNVITFVDKFYPNGFQTDARYFVEHEYMNMPSSPIDEFEVHFRNGTILEFNRRGNLTSIECGWGDYININILPSNIKSQIIGFNKKIIELNIDYDRRGRNAREYEIEFENGFECNYNNKGKLIH